MFVHDQIWFALGSGSPPLNVRITRTGRTGTNQMGCFARFARWLPPDVKALRYHQIALHKDSAESSQKFENGPCFFKAMEWPRPNLVDPSRIIDFIAAPMAS